MIIRVGHIDSTQRIARALLDDGAPHGTVVVAQRQNAGRGRRGRTWLSADEGLYASWVLRPMLDARIASRVTMSTAAAIVTALDALGVKTLIKWPNDIVIPHEDAGPLGPFRKVGGILVEVVQMKEKLEPGTSPGAGACPRLESAVLGVGINIRGAPADDLATTAAALSDAGFMGHADDVLRPIHATLLDHLAIDPFPFVRARSATLGRRVKVEGMIGEAVRIDDNGALVLHTDDGEHVLHAGDVQVIP